MIAALKRLRKAIARWRLEAEIRNMEDALHCIASQRANDLAAEKVFQEELAKARRELQCLARR